MEEAIWILQLSNIVYSHLFSCFCKINNYYHLPCQVFFPTIICLFLWFIRTFFIHYQLLLLKKKGKKRKPFIYYFQNRPRISCFFAVFSFIYFPHNICIQLNLFSPFLTLSKQILHYLLICLFLFFIYHSFNNSFLLVTYCLDFFPTRNYLLISYFAVHIYLLVNCLLASTSLTYNIWIFSLVLSFK